MMLPASIVSGLGQYILLPQLRCTASVGCDDAAADVLLAGYVSRSEDLSHLTGCCSDACAVHGLMASNKEFSLLQGLLLPWASTVPVSGGCWVSSFPCPWCHPL